MTPSAGFWFGLSGSDLVTLMSFLRQFFWNNALGLVCSFELSIVSSAGTPSSMAKVFNSHPASDFLAIGCISAKQVPLENTWAHRLPSTTLLDRNSCNPCGHWLHLELQPFKKPSHQ
jgi:hypothetical protein